MLVYGSLLASISVALAWMISMPGVSFSGALPEADPREEAFQAELRVHVQKLAGDIGERNVPTFGALKAAADYLERTLTDLGYTVHHHTYPVYDRICDNLDVDVVGGARRDQIVLVGAHYDSVTGAPGADDNASGSAAVLSLARVFAGKRPARTIRFALFANEEPPYFWNPEMGSLVYAKEARARGDDIVAMLSLETLGYYAEGAGTQRYPFPMSLFYPDRGDFVGFVGNTSSRGLTREVVRSFRGGARFPSEGAALPGFIAGVGWSDQWSFWQVGYPGVMVTDTAPFRNPNYHKRTDRPETLDYPRFARVTAGLERVIEALANP